MSTSPASYHYPAVTYATNNNVNDPTCHEGHVSLGLSDDTFKQTTAIQDLEEAWAHFPTPEQGQLSQRQQYSRPRHYGS
jgi:hypothetical protein